MNPFEQLQHAFYQFLETQLQISPEIISQSQFELNTDPEKQQFGDINSNIAMICAQKLKKNPRILAQEIIQNFKHPFIEKIEVAGPGFLNFFLTNAWFTIVATEIYKEKSDFFKSTIKKQENINIEFVSANPTGPMHVGHGRNGILGDVLANVLTFLNHNVTKEFYINDAGAQITKLGNSFKTRCLQARGINTNLPEDAYHGEYLVELAAGANQEFGANLESESDHFFQNYAKEKMLQELQITLENYGILFDVWFSEKTLHDQGKIEQALQCLIQSGHTFENDGALWFRSTTFGDDKDRVLKKANGELTYIAADVAYLVNKLNRGFEKLIFILGHDHHSYKIRLESIMQALGYDHKNLTIILYQLVHVLKDGQPVKMSKRSGNMVTLKEVIEEVGKNTARFFFLNRKADAELQFDIDVALKQSNENPVFYIQYAYVRTLSIQKKAAEMGLSMAAIFNTDHTPMEKLIIKKLCSLKLLISNIANHHQIHLLAYYSYELASLFHQYYNQQRVLDSENPIATSHRLYLINTIQETLKTSLFLMGITPMEQM